MELDLKVGSHVYIYYYSYPAIKHLEILRGFVNLFLLRCSVRKSDTDQDRSETVNV